MPGRQLFGHWMKLVALAALVAACGAGAQPIATFPGSIPTAGPTAASATVAPTTPPVATAASTVAPVVTDAPVGEGKLEKVREIVLAWKSYAGSQYVNYQVILEIKNTGTGWARASGFDSDYTVYDADDGVTATGSFTYEYPEYIAPGATGYLIEESSQDGVKVADFATVEIDGRYDPVDEPGITIEVSGIKLRNEAYSDGLTATGFVTASEDTTDAAVAVICLNQSGKPLGATTTNLIQNLTAGKRKGFETVGGTPPLRISQCAKVVGFAKSTEF